MMRCDIQIGDVRIRRKALFVLGQLLRANPLLRAAVSQVIEYICVHMCVRASITGSCICVFMLPHAPCAVSPHLFLHPNQHPHKSILDRPAGSGALMWSQNGLFNHACLPAAMEARAWNVGSIEAALAVRSGVPMPQTSLALTQLATNRSKTEEMPRQTRGCCQSWSRC